MFWLATTFSSEMAGCPGQYRLSGEKPLRRGGLVNLTTHFEIEHGSGKSSGRCSSIISYWFVGKAGGRRSRFATHAETLRSHNVRQHFQPGETMILRCRENFKEEPRGKFGGRSAHLWAIVFEAMLPASATKLALSRSASLSIWLPLPRDSDASPMLGLPPGWLTVSPSVGTKNYNIDAIESSIQPSRRGKLSEVMKRQAIGVSPSTDVVRGKLSLSFAHWGHWRRWSSSWINQNYTKCSRKFIFGTHYF